MLYFCLFISVLLVSGCAPSRKTPMTVENFVRQVRGEHVYWHPTGEEPGAFDWRQWRDYRPRCKKFAIERLGDMGHEAVDAVPDLVDILVHGPNDFDSGDGVIGFRSSIAIALGEIGDPRAIEPLIASLHRCERATGRHTIASPRAPRGVDHEGIIKSLMLFGKDAEHARPVLKELEAKYGADVLYCERAKYLIAEGIEYFESGEKERREMREDLVRFGIPQMKDPYYVAPVKITEARHRPQ